MSDRAPVLPPPGYAEIPNRVRMPHDSDGATPRTMEKMLARQLRPERATIGLCWGTVHQASLVELVEGAARHGFPTIQICPELYFGYLETGGNAKALRRRLADAGVVVSLIDGISGGLPGLPTEPIRFKGQTMPRHDVNVCAPIAEAVGAPLVNLSPYGGEPVAVGEMAEALRAVCRKAAQHGAAITLEAVPESSVRSLAEARTVIEACGEPNCFAMLDTWHLARSGGSVADIRALPAGMLGSFQISDRTEPPPGTAYVPLTGRKLPGEGELPLWDYVAAALTNNPALPVEIEVFSAELEALPADEGMARVAAAVDAWRTSATGQQMEAG